MLRCVRRFASTGALMLAVFGVAALGAAPAQAQAAPKVCVTQFC